jgi:hypothetical protein
LPRRHRVAGTAGILPARAVDEAGASTSWFPTEDYARKWQEFCLTAAVKDVAGTKRVVTDGRFAQANAGPLDTILGEGRLLVARCGRFGPGDAGALRDTGGGGEIGGNRIRVQAVNRHYGETQTPTMSPYA